MSESKLNFEQQIEIIKGRRCDLARRWGLIEIPNVSYNPLWDSVDENGDRIFPEQEQK